MSANEIAAEILESSANAFARQTSLRLETHLAGSDIELDLASNDWQADALQRITELVASLRLNQPDLFVEKAQWLARAYAARGVPVEVPRSELLSLREALAEDFPEQSAAAVIDIVDKALAALEQQLDPIERSFDTDDPYDVLTLRYLAAAMEGRADEAISLVIEAIESDISPEDAISRVIIPAQREIGDMWHRDEVSIAQEHLVSNTTMDLLAVITSRFATESDPDRNVIIASVAGNPHDIGIRATNAIFRLAGWQTVILGTDLPPNEIAAAAEHFDTEIVVLSATLATHVPAVRQTINAIRQSSARPAILVGGRAFEFATGLWKDIGADAISPDIESAVEMASRLRAARKN